MSLLLVNFVVSFQNWQNVWLLSHFYWLQSYLQGTKSQFLHSLQQELFAFCFVFFFLFSSISFIGWSLILLLPVYMCRQISSVKEIIKIKLIAYLNNTGILSSAHYRKILRALSWILMITLNLSLLSHFYFSAYKGLGKNYTT